MPSITTEYPDIKAYLITSLGAISGVTAVIEGDFTRSQKYSDNLDSVAFYSWVDIPLGGGIYTPPAARWKTYEATIRVGIAIQDTLENGQSFNEFAHLLWDWIGQEWLAFGLANYSLELVSSAQEQRYGNYQTVSYLIKITK
jgi:hypothetical protein